MNCVGTLEQIYAEMKDRTHDFTVNNECSSCGSCCSNLLPMSTKDIKKIRWYIKKNHIKEQKHTYPFSVAVFDLVCPFRSDTEKKCTIYEVRPDICRDFRCDKPKKDIKMSKELAHKKYSVCDLRELFYGGNTDDNA